MKGIVHPKIKIKIHYLLLSPKLFQTCMSFFLLLNTKEDIWKNVVNQFVLVMAPINSIVGQKYHGSQWVLSTCLVTNIVQNIFFCAQHK